jgi:hypothetical protein
MKKRFEELEKALTEVCEKHESDCSKCPRQAECEEYARLYRQTEA